MTFVFQLMDTGIKRLARLFMILASVLLAIMALIGTADVLSLNLLGRPVPSATELSAAMLSITVMMGMSYTQRERAHISVNLFWRFFPHPLRVFAEGFALFIGLCVFALITWGAWELAQHSLNIRERAVASVRFPLWPIKLVFWMGALVCALEILRELVRFLFCGDRAAVAGADPVADTGSLEQKG